MNQIDNVLTASKVKGDCETVKLQGRVFVSIDDLLVMFVGLPGDATITIENYSQMLKTLKANAVPIRPTLGEKK